MNASRDLLVGLLLLRNGFIDQVQLAAAFSMPGSTPTDYLVDTADTPERKIISEGLAQCREDPDPEGVRDPKALEIIPPLPGTRRAGRALVERRLDSPKSQCTQIIHDNNLA